MRVSSQVMGKNENRACKFVGRAYFTLTSNAQTWVLNLTPLGLDARLVTVSDGWQEFKFTKVLIKAWLGNIVAASPSVTPGGANLALAYSPNILGSGPISVQELMNLQNVAVGNGTYGCPYPRLALAKSALTSPGPVKWFRRGTPFDDTLEVQGSIYFASTDTWSARPLTMFVEYEIEFRVPADTALTSASPEAKVNTDPAVLAKQIEEMQLVLGLKTHLVQRVPNKPPPEPDFVVVKKGP